MNKGDIIGVLHDKWNSAQQHAISNCLSTYSGCPRESWVYYHTFVKDIAGLKVNVGGIINTSKWNVKKRIYALAPIISGEVCAYGTMTKVSKIPTGKSFGKG